MIICRSPLRISLGGGGTDLPSYYKKKGGFLIAAAINKHVYISIAETFNKKFLIKYSKYEIANKINEIKHPIFRESLKLLNIKTPLNICSHSDIAAGTGLGSSGAFTVSLINSLSRHLGQKLTKASLAETACKIEIDILKEPIGKQDQYVATFGGINEYYFSKKNEVYIKKLKINNFTKKKLNQNLLIFFTGYSRSSYKILKIQDQKTKLLDKIMIKNLDQIKELGLSSGKALKNGNLKEFASILDFHWNIKKKRSNNISNKKINYIYDFAKDNGAIGGKLIGAGGGGFLMLYSDDTKTLEDSMKKKGYEKLNYKFDEEGSKIIS